MKLCVFTIVRDGMPWLPCIYTALNQLHLDWHWIVVEGTALNTHCSSHCQAIEPHLSTDGTTEWLRAMSSNRRITVLSKLAWDGKIEMVNAAVAQVKQPCVLMQMDSDEIWSAKNINAAYDEIAGCSLPIALNVKCRYFVGPDLIAVSPHKTGTDLTNWVRAWKYQPGMRFKSHCPPVLDGPMVGSYDISFDHYAYVLEQQVRFKERYYGFQNMLDGWKLLQEQDEFPLPLRRFWPYRWVDEGTLVHRI